MNVSAIAGINESNKINTNQNLLNGYLSNVINGLPLNGYGDNTSYDDPGDTGSSDTSSDGFDWKSWLDTAGKIAKKVQEYEPIIDKYLPKGVKDEVNKYLPENNNNTGGGKGTDPGTGPGTNQQQQQYYSTGPNYLLWGGVAVGVLAFSFLAYKILK